MKIKVFRFEGSLASQIEHSINSWLERETPSIQQWMQSQSRANDGDGNPYADVTITIVYEGKRA